MIIVGVLHDLHTLEFAVFACAREKFQFHVSNRLAPAFIRPQMVRVRFIVTAGK